MRRISKSGLAFIKSFESFVPYVYDDKRAPVRGKYREWDGGSVVGTLTIGYGHTNSAKHPLKIAKGLHITEAEGRDILDVDLDECEEAVNKQVKVPIEQGQFDALTSFAFNCGAGNLKNLTARLNRGDYKGTRAAFDHYVKSKGEFMRGLQRRRDGEQVMWDEDVPSLPDEPVDHPAEVDAPAAPFKIPAADHEKRTTTKDLAKVSRKASWVGRMTKAFHTIWISLSLASFLEYLGIAKETIDSISQVVQNNAVALSIGGAVLGALALKYVMSLMVEDVNEGRAVPSGESAGSS